MGKVKISYGALRDIAQIDSCVGDYLKKTYPEAFGFYCKKCKNKIPCSVENFGIECKVEIKFKNKQVYRTECKPLFFGNIIKPKK